jgi:hypothetical protein
MVTKRSPGDRAADTRAQGTEMERRLVGMSWLAGACTVVLAGTCFPGWGYPDLANLSAPGILSVAALFLPGVALMTLR